MSKGIGGTSSSQSVSAEPRLAEREAVGSLTCGLMPAGEVRDSGDSVDERPLSAAKLSAETQEHSWLWNAIGFQSSQGLHVSIWEIGFLLHLSVVYYLYLVLF